jgi:hypothetical protein
MQENERGGLEDAPTERRTVTRQESGADAPAEESADSERESADEHCQLRDYQFSAEEKTSKYAPISAEDIDDVYAVVCTLTEDTVVHLDCEDVAQCAQGQSLELCETSISRAIRLLAEDDQCPLEIERWSGKSTIPTLWRVTAPDCGHTVDNESATSDGGDSHAT